MAEQKLRAIMIVEMAGRPPKHLEETLKLHIGQLKQLKDVEIVNETISDPKRLESEQEMYTCFAEVEIKVIGLARLIELIFDFMPSSIEILEPSELKFDVLETTSFLNNLTGRLHRYDEIAKIAQLQTQQYARKLQIMQQELMKKNEEKKEEKIKKSKKRKKPVKKKKTSKKK